MAIFSDEGTELFICLKNDIWLEVSFIAGSEFVIPV
jgi:hypothetical protein